MIRRVVWLLFICVLGRSTGFAASSGWKSLGPFSGAVSSIAIDAQNADIIYISTGTGVFKSTNGGTSWLPIYPGILSATVVVDPADSSVVYCGGPGVWKSVDGGATWNRASNGLTLGPPIGLVQVLTLALDPQNPVNLYAGTTRGLYRSKDGGATWTRANTGLPTIQIAGQTVGASVGRILIDPMNSATVYIHNGGQSIFKSTDAGDSWNPLILPIASTATVAPPISSIALDPQNPKMLYASQSCGGCPLMKSTDGGAGWTTLGLPNSLGFPIHLTTNAHYPNTLFAGTSTGLYRSTDGGVSWLRVNGLPSNGVAALVAFDHQTGSTVLAEVYGAGLFKSTDRMEHWANVSTGLSTATIISLAQDASSAIYAAGWGTDIQKSIDAGTSWTSLKILPTNPAYAAEYLAIDPKHPDIIYVVTGAPEGLAPISVAKSFDGGAAWNVSDSGLPKNLSWVSFLVIDPFESNNIYIGTDRGIFHSTDSGLSWTAYVTDVPKPANSIEGTLFFDPRTPGTRFVANASGLWKSNDEGVTWSGANFGVPEKSSIAMLAFDPQALNIVYAATWDGRVLKSSDNANSWALASTGLPSAENWTSGLVIDPRNPDTIYLSTSGALFDSCYNPCSGLNDGVFRSTDGARSWTVVNDGLSTPHVSSLIMDSQNPNKLYAGTIGGGVFGIDFTPTVTGLTFDRPSAAAGTSYTVTFAGENLDSDTFFDVAFTAPDGASAVALNWQWGDAASHDVPAETLIGDWTIIGVRPHESETDHAGTFDFVSAMIRVSAKN